MGLSHTSSYLFLSSFCIHVILLLLFFSSNSSAMGNNETDRLALLQFKAQITDPLGVMNSWNDTIHFCKWYGVRCGCRHQRVTMLVLRSLKLTGSISPHIGNLSFLRVLDLANNSFSQEIPPEIGHLRRLQRLCLLNNSIGGEIPSNISSCFNLISISFVYNMLEGKIPVDLGSLLKLQFIDLGHNNLTGSIPSSFGNLSSLEVLSIIGNALSGSIPDALGQLKNLRSIELADNSLSGTIPPSIFNLSSIQVLDVGQNHLHGNLPSALGISLPNLQFFSIFENQFTGSIPVSLSNASKLEVLELNINKLKGRVPSLKNLLTLWFLNMASNHRGSGGGDDLIFLSSLTNTTTLEALVIGGNYFGGMLPECICNFSTKFRRLDLSNNQIYGSIPTGIANLVNLQIFEASDNYFSGIIPPNIGMLQNLSRLNLARNNFLEYIPSSIGNLTNLIFFSLEGNNLQGSIPSSLGNCQNLQELYLSKNNLSGAIPPQVIGLSSLSIFLDLSSNHLTGSLPMEIGNLQNLGALNLSENLLSGKIPSSLGSCTSLEVLNMDGNFFHGPIPSSLSSLQGLQVLGLSRNNLSGAIPEFLGGFALQCLNLSFNDFEGKMPIEGVFKNASVTSVMGNKKLCGGIPEFHLPTCNLEKSNNMRLTHKLESIISIVSVLLGVTLVLSFTFLLRFRKKREELTSGPFGPLLWTVSYQNLLKATDGFSSSNLIGVGSFGTVYKGILDQGGTIVAVKVLNLFHRRANRSFMAECEALRNIRHRNLVKVLTACSSIDYHGNDFKALVYDYMVNGSLEDWLHPPAVGTSEVDEARKNMDFHQRLNIAIDVACALEYLHHHCETPIIHCDLKPSNVLLDDEMTAHLGDFGLAKFLSQGSATIGQSSSVGVRGTIGYAPPEYGVGSNVSTYGDVYSYGILLLEMFTRKRPTDDMFKEGLNLHNFAKATLPERVAEITDSVLLEEREEAEMSTNRTRNRRHTSHLIQECLILIFEIGIACSVDLPGERMNISDVAAKLNFVREKLLRTTIHGERRYAQTVQLQSAGAQG